MNFGAVGGAAGFEQLKGLQAAGLIDAETLKLIEATMANPTAELDRLHASGLMSDEIYAQAMASVTAATSAAGPSLDAAELDLLQNGESAPATVLAMPEPTDHSNARPLIKLEIHPASGPPYPVDCAIASVPPGADPKVGDFLQVRVDSKDPMRVAIDWTGFGT